MPTLRSSLLALALLAVGAAPAAALTEDDRYKLQGGCFELRPAAGGNAVAGGPFRMQATDLGKYLLYAKGGRFLSAGSGDAVATAAEPSENGNWRVDVRGDAYTLTLPSGKALAAGGRTVGAAGAFGFAPAEGCDVFPEAALNVDGEPTRFPTAWGEVTGMLDAHMHWMGFEFLGGRAHCGRPWHEYGITKALVDCPDHSVPGSPGNTLEAALGGPPTHDTEGWPGFPYWPNPDSLTHEGTYHRWVERAWRAGLRLFVNLHVDNGQLCTLMPDKSHDCNEMNTVRLEIRRLKEIQDYVDALSGGPGKGWFRIVDDPFEARAVISEGKLAVIHGIEISRLFDCQLYNGVPICDKAKIDRDLEEVYRAGVRAMEIVNKFDNAFVGVAGDSDTQGVIVNAGNKLETGQYWDMKTCQGLPEGIADKTQYTGPDPARDAIVSSVYGPLAPAGAAPVYPDPPHCNTRGLSSLGEYLLDRMMAKGMIIDPDHMSVLARRQTLDLLEARQYGGVVSSHSWSTDDAYPRILKLGGVITPISASSTAFVREWRQHRKNRDPRYLFGFGFGADMNGFHHMGSPRADAGETAVKYPFKSLDGKQTIHRQTTGERTWDINKDGTAHYGLLPDWVQDAVNLAGPDGPTLAADMRRGAEAYLQMWERALGVQMRRPEPARNRFSRAGLGKVLLGVSHEALLRSAGQPAVRGAHVWRYQVQQREKRTGRISVALDSRGRSALVASTYPEHEVQRVGAGDRASRVGRARRLGSGVLVRDAGKGRRFVFGVRSGRVRYAAVATAAATKDAATLRRHLRRAGLG